MTAPDVSIVIPCHNYAAYLPACLVSVRRQQLDAGSFEVIAIDDASTDDTWDVLQRYAGWTALRAYREQSNQGYVAVYRRGMSLACGRALVPLDADDLVVQADAVRRQLALLDAHPRVAFVHSAYREIDGSGRTIGERHPERTTGVRTGRTAFRRLLLGNFVQHSGTLIRRDAYEAVGGYDEHLTNSIDWDLWLRLAKTNDVAYIDEPLYAYRLHPWNMHKRMSRPGSHERILAEVFAVIDNATRDEPRAVRDRAYAEAHAMTATFLFADFRFASGIERLGRALTTDPSIVLRQHFREALARLVVGRVLGRRGYALARRLHRRSA